MKRKTAVGLILAAGLFAGAQSATAQSVTCQHSWCWTHVWVTQNASGAPVVNLTWNEFRMPNKLSGVTLAWLLVGSPDYEFRSDSVNITGPNAMGSYSQLPRRENTATLYPRDDLNTNSLTYGYEVRVYRKGTPPGAPAAVATGSIVNSSN